MPLRSEGRYISPEEFQTGMMIDFSYTKRDSTVQRYLAIVIDPAKKTGDNIYLHALLIDGLSDMELVRLSIEVGQVFNYDPDDREAPITYLQSDDAYSRYKASPFLNQRIYRTFLLENVTSPRQILIGELE
jgi:hypothetical protein